ncbi:hypothetical protein Pen01_41720 [Phytomonospora endophytica]|nr:hypothetical protein Pen01_41720 [Phytomonospora endophytica]
MLGQVPRHPVADVDGLEHPVPAQNTEVIGGEEGCVGRYHAPAKDGDNAHERRGYTGRLGSVIS